MYLIAGNFNRMLFCLINKNPRNTFCYRVQRGFFTFKITGHFDMHSARPLCVIRFTLTSKNQNSANQGVDRKG